LGSISLANINSFLSPKTIKQLNGTPPYVL
jgi:hypothetical protein